MHPEVVVGPVSLAVEVGMAVVDLGCESSFDPLRGKRLDGNMGEIGRMLGKDRTGVD